jgi:hypothetical protein
MVIRTYLRLVKFTLQYMSGPSLLSSCYFSMALPAVLRELKGSQVETNAPAHMNIPIIMIVVAMVSTQVTQIELG